MTALVVCELFVVFQSLSHVPLSVTPWTAEHQVSLSFTISKSLLKLMSTELVMPSNHLILCHPLLLLSLIIPSHRVLSNLLALRIRWPKYWSFIFSISPSNEYLGLISFRIDWFDLLAVQGTLQHHSSKAPILECSALWSNWLGRNKPGSKGQPKQPDYKLKDHHSVTLQANSAQRKKDLPQQCDQVCLWLKCGSIHIDFSFS